MTANQKLIAETAIDRREAQTYEQIHEEVSKLTGITEGEVRDTLDYLSHECVLKQCATPARNVNEDPIVRDEPTWAWYAKGDSWPQ